MYLTGERNNKIKCEWNDFLRKVPLFRQIFLERSGLWCECGGNRSIL